MLDLAEGLLTGGHHVSIVYSGRRADEPFCRRANSLPRLRTHRVDMRRAPHPSDVVVVRSIRKYIAAEGPFDVIHGHSSKGGAIARLLKDSSDTPVVYTPHCIYTLNEEASRWARLLTAAVERQLARRTAAVIAVSPDEQEHIASLGIARQKLHCVINGISDIECRQRALGREHLGLHADGLVLGYLGRLSRQKNPLLLLEAFARLRDVAQVRLAIAGEGELDQPLREAARRLSIADRVHWLGHRAAEEVLPAFDVFVLPSNYEGMPYVLLEALAAGLPIVATDVGGVRLAVQDDENGYIVPRSSAGLLADALRKLINSAERRELFGAASRRLAGQFTVEQMVEQTISIYEQVRSGRV